jgi:predicted 3-demethylubiquinone-9 3-methyltransferase (glyoxalase superfamily)
MITKITPFLWFDSQAEEAAMLYTSIFKNSRVLEVNRYPSVGQEIHGREPGSVMTVLFELDGHRFTALNGGPHFKFNEAVSFEIECADQQEVDYYWEKLGAGGDPEAQQCGWLKDKFGLSWQVVPNVLNELCNDPDTAKSERTFEAMLRMQKLDVAALQRAHDGG